MASNEDFEYLENQALIVEDRVKSRILAYTTLLESVNALKDPELIAEGIKMLERARLSIKIHPDNHMNVVKGGKLN